ncbi:MAG: tetratricopeptide repeat protein [Symploca sp. SIO3E6]|nr:tetratricopeptide repeat protein [Caldora sp. SIO3E6]
MSSITPSGMSILIELGIEPSTIKSIKPNWKQNHYIAVINWLTRYDEPQDDSNLEKVRCYLEAFHHLCSVDDWEKASKILLTRLSTPTNEVLVNQINTWGYYQELINICQKFLDKSVGEFKSFLLFSLGNSYNALGNYNQAISYCHQSWEIAKEIPGSFCQALALTNRGNAHYFLGEFSKAIKYHRQSYDAAKKIADPESKIECKMNAINNLANSYQAVGEYREAMKYYQEALELSRKIQERHREGATLGNMGNSYQSLGEYEKAIKYHQDSLEISQEMQDSQQELNALGNLGVDYLRYGNYDKAIAFLQQSLELAKELNNPYAELSALGNLGNVYDSMKYYTMAIDFHNKSLVINKKIINRPYESELRFNLGNAYYGMQEFEKAIEYYEQSLEIIRYELLSNSEIRNISSSIEIPNYSPFMQNTPDLRWIDRRGEASILGDIGNCYLMLKNFEKTIEYYNQSLSIAKEIDDHRIKLISTQAIATAYRFLGKKYGALGKYDQGIYYTNKSNCYICKYLSMFAICLLVSILNTFKSLFRQNLSVRI